MNNQQHILQICGVLKGYTTKKSYLVSYNPLNYLNPKKHGKTHLPYAQEARAALRYFAAPPTQISDFDKALYAVDLLKTDLGKVRDIRFACTSYIRAYQPVLSVGQVTGSPEASLQKMRGQLDALIAKLARSVSSTNRKWYGRHKLSHSKRVEIRHIIAELQDKKARLVAPAVHPSAFTQPVRLAAVQPQVAQSSPPAVPPVDLSRLPLPPPSAFRQPQVMLSGCDSDESPRTPPPPIGVVGSGVVENPVLPPPIGVISGYSSTAPVGVLAPGAVEIPPPPPPIGVANPGYQDLPTPVTLDERSRPIQQPAPVADSDADVDSEIAQLLEQDHANPAGPSRLPVFSGNPPQEPGLVRPVPIRVAAPPSTSPILGLPSAANPIGAISSAVQGPVITISPPTPPPSVAPSQVGSDEPVLDVCGDAESSHGSENPGDAPVSHPVTGGQADSGISHPVLSGGPNTPVRPSCGVSATNAGGLSRAQLAVRMKEERRKIAKRQGISPASTQA